jgi:amino acid adenylation domain-containing protein
VKSVRASHVESLFFLSEDLHPTPGLNTITHAVHIGGPLAVERLARTMLAIYRRQDILRSRFAAADGAIIRVLTDEAPPPSLAVQDTPDNDDAVERAAESLRQGLSSEARPWGMALLRHSPEKHTFLFSAHRIVWDEWSTRILGQEITKGYRADFESDRSCRPPAQVANAVERGLAGSDDDDVSWGARYLAAALADVPLLLGFPLKNSRPRTLSVAASNVEVDLDEGTRVLLAQRAEEWGVQPFILEGAAAVYVLASYCGQKAMSVGLPFDLRAGQDCDGALGSYTAMLPLGVDITKSGTFEALSRTLADQYRSAAQHANTPFHAVISACGARTDPSANPLFQVACVADEPLMLDLDGCVCSPRRVSVPPQQVDLFLQLGPGTLRLGFSTAIVTEDIASSFVRSMSVFLAIALREPGRELSKQPLLGDSDRQLLLLGHNNTDEPSFVGRDLFEALSRHLSSDNQKIALVSSGRSTSYAELEGSVHAIAQRLSDSQLTAGGVVGICLPRSADMVAAVLAVLRCGAAYVPLDPAFPRERLRYMVDHSRLDRVITTASLRSLFESAEVRFIELDRAHDASAAIPEVGAASPDDTAYVIYTSGSTGKPKGVAISRGAVVNFLLSMLQRPGIRTSDTLCAVTTLSFDIAVLELLAPLCAGGTVVIATEEEARDPRLLLDLLRANRVTVMQATPVTWHMLLSAGWAGNTSLRALCGGEALSPTLAQALKPRVGELWNMYGPTETTVWSTCHRIGDPEAAISVGTPIHNTTVYIVDEFLRPVPAGVEGRLFIGGAGVALGYLHDEELTRRRFLADPFRGIGKMYDTGDIARLGAGGVLYIIGRSDFQVKLRGFRIELGEIEARLSTYPSIDQVVSVVRKDDPANPELVAYYSLKNGQGEPTVAELRDHCGATLPAHMLPTRFRKLDAIPRTPNGKVDRAALPSPTTDPSQDQAGPVPIVARNDLERVLSEIWCSVLSLPSAGIHDNFFELGGTSLAAFSIVLGIAQRLAIEISVLKLFEYPTIATLAQFLKGRDSESSVVRDAYGREKARRNAAVSETAFDVAIVGMAGRFPGARDLDELWRNLSEGRETVTVFKREDLDPLVPAHDRNDPSYIPARGILDGVDLFDAAFFGITPNEAELMDPQLRVFMETAWEAFENAGYVGESIHGLVGVWAGMGNNFYYHHHVLTRPDKLAIMGEIAAEIANEKDHIAPRVSHKLNLKGPSLSVHTACSTSLVVIENAYQALVSHQVDVALAGGVDIRTPQRSGQRHEEGGVFSDDGHCRPFDARATGTMFGEGVGAVVLKRLDDAVRDRDTIYAVIKGAAVNHDGGQKVSYLAPSVEGQARVVAAAMGLAGINPDTISLIEAHGTATPIGDPIEVEALTRVFRTFTQRRRYCAIGSIKGNFGHATTAAGIAGTLKLVLALRNRKIPATLHFATPNPRIDFASSPFFVNNKLIDWESQEGPRRAGVSSFGFCGTNAHVLLEEAPIVAPSSAPARPVQLLLLSARNPQALDDGARRLSVALNDASPAELADAAFTTHVGRKRFEYRRCAVLNHANEASEVLSQATGARSASLKSSIEKPPVAFMFPGQGAQYINMGLRLYQGEPYFRDAVDRCSAILAPHLGCDLRGFLFPAAADAEAATQSLNNTFYTQPSIFTVSYALATLFMRWGIAPAAFIGHSIGEFVAATFSGVMELEDALRLVATRGRLMQGLPGGSMLSVRLPLESLVERLPDGIDVAAVNSPQLCVVAGPTPLVGRFSEQLSAEGVACRLLHTSHAFHSSMMDAVVEPFLRTVETVSLSAPTIPFVSTVVGDWVKASDVTDPSYWARHLRSTVQFAKAAQIALTDPQQILMECGPRRTCAALALQQRPTNPHRVLASMPDSGDPNDEYSSLILALGRLWLNGCAIDWSAFHQGEMRRRIALPSYSFQRRRYWIEPGATAALSAEARVLLSAPAGAAPRSEPDAMASNASAIGPGDDLTKTVVSYLEELQGGAIESFDEDGQFIALGLDSLLLTQLARAVRVRLGFEVTFRDLTERYSTTRLLVDAIRASQVGTHGGIHRSCQVSSNTMPCSPATQTVEVAPVNSTKAPAATVHGRIPGARLGRDENGRPAWFVSDPNRPGKYIQVLNHE